MHTIEQHGLALRIASAVRRDAVPLPFAAPLLLDALECWRPAKALAQASMASMPSIKAMPTAVFGDRTYGAAWAESPQSMSAGRGGSWCITVRRRVPGDRSLLCKIEPNKSVPLFGRVRSLAVLDAHTLLALVQAATSPVPVLTWLTVDDNGTLVHATAATYSRDGRECAADSEDGPGESTTPHAVAVWQRNVYVLRQVSESDKSAKDESKDNAGNKDDDEKTVKNDDDEKTVKNDDDQNTVEKDVKEAVEKDAKAAKDVIAKGVAKDVAKDDKAAIDDNKAEAPKTYTFKRKLPDARFVVDIYAAAESEDGVIAPSLRFRRRVPLIGTPHKVTSVDSSKAGDSTQLALAKGPAQRLDLHSKAAEEQRSFSYHVRLPHEQRIVYYSNMHD